MINYNDEIVDILNDYFLKNDEFVESIRLSSYGLQIQFVNFDIHCNERVFASIGGKSYEWNDAPNSGPWGALGRQRATKASLKKQNILTITFETGDTVDIETVVGQYESVQFTFPPMGESIVMEIF